MTVPARKPQAGMPKWLLYGLIAKGLTIVAVVAAVLFHVNFR
jgi:hypothetical protein